MEDNNLKPILVVRMNTNIYKDIQGYLDFYRARTRDQYHIIITGDPVIFGRNSVEFEVHSAGLPTMKTP